MNKNQCIICEKNSVHGIMICGKKICASCEKEIVKILQNTGIYEICRRKIKSHLAEKILKKSEI